MKKKKIWRWMAAAGGFTLLAGSRMTMRGYGGTGLAGGIEYEVSGPDECRRLMMEVVSSVRERGRYEFYVAGRDYEPETLVIAQMFPEVVNISNTKLRTYEEEGHEVTLCRIGFEWRRAEEDCEHVFEKEILEESGCLTGGMERIFCELCGWEEITSTAPYGHADQNKDSLCDRCGERFLAQKQGDVITVFYGSEGGGEERPMEFRCVREDYGGGMLYECTESIPTQEILAAVGEVEGSEEERIRWWLNTDFYNGISVRNACEEVLLLDSAGEPAEEGRWNGTIEVRPGLVLRIPVTDEEAERAFWTVGDVQVRKIGENTYRFRCVDEDYKDSNSNYRKSALFLCETVIRSDVDSTDSKREILPFGGTNQYKSSTVREWLQKNTDENTGDVMRVFTGVNSAFEGKTADGLFHEMTGQGLIRRELPFQMAEDGMFLLSVEEALEYGEALWEPEGMGSPYSRGYWLRTPVFEADENGNFIDGTWEYAVDLERGCLRPAKVTDTAFGIRPAFCLPQA